MWIIADSRLTNTEFNEFTGKTMEKPYPSSLWRIEKNILTTHLFWDAKEFNLWTYPREHTIRVYDFQEPQSGFQHNGLAILRPSECISTHELNGRWDVTLTHPIDPQGRYKYLTPPNVLKIDGQLFRIDEHESTVDQSGAVIKVKTHFL